MVGTMTFVFKHPSKYKKQKKEVSGYYIADGKVTTLYNKKQTTKERKKKNVKKR